MTKTNESLEKLLRTARRARGLSLEDAAKDTKVRKVHLKQFETNIPEKLDVYQKGYLGLYGRYLGVDIQAHADAANKAKLSQPQRTSKPMNDKTKSETSPPYSRRNFLLAGGLMLALTTLTIAGQQISGTVKDRWASLWSIKQEESAQVPEQIADTIVVAIKATAEQINPNTHVLTGLQSPESDVRITANKPTAFTATDPGNDKILLKGQLKAGEVLALPTVNSLTIKTSAPDALDVKLSRNSNIPSINKQATEIK